MTTAARFWPKVERRGPDECWPWTASFGTTGYGQFYCDGGPKKAPRVAFFLEHGHWPQVCRHSCDNPACCNPAHLLDGTHADNSRDVTARGRWPKSNHKMRGLQNPRGKLNDDEVNDIRTLYGQCSALALAKAFGVSRGHVKNIAHGRDRAA